MRVPAIPFKLALVLATLGTTALAQVTTPDGTPAEEKAAVPANENAEAGTPPAKEGADEDPTRAIAPADFLPQAQERLSAMRNALSKGLDELKEAREAKDAVRLTCVNEQVAAMKGILRVAETALIRLQEAQGANDGDVARYEFRKIYLAKNNIDDLLQAAVNCAGAESTESDTSVDLEIDPAIANVDPYYGDPGFFFDPQDAIVDGDSGIVGEGDPPTVRPQPASGVI